MEFNYDTVDHALPLDELIQGCKRCPLVNNMIAGPIAPEWKGDPRGGVMMITSQNLSAENDIMQEVVSGVNRTILINIIEQYSKNWYITNFVKCRPQESGVYKAGETRCCINWLDIERERVKPSVVIGFGTGLKKFVQCDYYLPSVNNLVGSQKNRQLLIDILKENYVDSVS
jgi:uracil-DNA glycosylase family 4